MEFDDVVYLKAKAIIPATGSEGRIYQLTINAHTNASMRCWSSRMADILLQDMEYGTI
ncbi:MAG: hypothetical protein ACTS8H_02310 [Arsenophonus sp. NC-PE1-MAG3]